MILYTVKCFADRDDDHPEREFAAVANNNDELAKLIHAHSIASQYLRFDADPCKLTDGSVSGPPRILGELGIGRFNFR